jgi:hypothetical protein
MKFETELQRPPVGVPGAMCNNIGDNRVNFYMKENIRLLFVPFDPFNAWHIQYTDIILLWLIHLPCSTENPILKLP